MSRRTGIRLVALAVVLLIALAGWAWFAPSGAGEFRHSPDGQFTAHAMNMSAGTLTGGWDHYNEVRVVEEGSGREVWRLVRRYPPGADVPDYRSRAGRLITWATDSSSVAVPIGGGQQLVLAVP